MPSDIIIVGLGPGNPSQITLEAWRVLEEASEVHLRTIQHPSIAGLPQSSIYKSFDHVYEAFNTFDEVYAEIARNVVALGQRPQGVVYAVPGHPLVGETSVSLILNGAREAGLSVHVVAGISFLEPIFTVLELDPFSGLQICDATVLAQRHHPNLDPDLGALVVQVYNRHLAGEVKLTLMNLYHDDHPITIVCAAGTDRERVSTLPLYELDRHTDPDALTSIYIPPLPQPGSLSSYQNIVAHLRAPGGCPWDREQTHQTLRTHLLEETYEVLAALDADDMESLREELGDLLLQILLHAQIATEDGDFKLIDTIQLVSEKLVRRHPHVFGEANVTEAEEVLKSWEQIKREERRKAGKTARSLLSGVPAALPALSQALEMQRRAARVGFDWPELDPVVDKVHEEAQELRAADSPEERRAEMGDLLFALVNLARHYEIDPESSLRETNQRFARRFAAIERYAREAGIPVEEMPLEEMDRIWEAAKRDENDRPRIGSNTQPS